MSNYNIRLIVPICVGLICCAFILGLTWWKTSRSSRREIVHSQETVCNSSSEASTDNSEHKTHGGDKSRANSNLSSPVGSSRQGTSSGEKSVEKDRPSGRTEGIRWHPVGLNWVPIESYPKPDNAPEATEPWRTPKGEASWLDEWPPNSLGIEVSLRDALTGNILSNEVPKPSSRIDVIDSNGKLRVSGREYGPHCHYVITAPSNLNYLVRAQTDTQIGYCVFGFGSGALAFGGENVVMGLTVSSQRRCLVRCVILMASAADRAAGAQIKVTDPGGKPLSGTLAYLGRAILGQANEDGIISIPIPDFSKIPETAASSSNGAGSPKQPELPHPLRQLWNTKNGALAISYPGKVPLFIPIDKLLPHTVRIVPLLADELVVTFSLRLPAGTPINEPKSSRYGRVTSNDWGHFDRSVLPVGVKLREVLDASQWKTAAWPYGKNSVGSGLGHPTGNNTTELEAVIGTPFERWMDYDRWYSNQWTHDEASGDWKVIIPHKGRFIITINEERREIWRNTTKYLEFMMYPGLFLDATDPTSPKFELIYAP